MKAFKKEQDVKMKKKEVLDYVEYTLKYAEYKCGTSEDAKDISQEVLLEMLVAIEKGQKISSPKAWISSVVNNKYMDILRRKYKRREVYYDVAYEEITYNDDILDKMIDSQEYVQVRKRIAYLTKIYREVIIRYYFNRQSIKAIAEDLRIPQNTVKSRLDVGRKHIRKGMDMSERKYVKQSMEPDDLWLSINGRCGSNGEPCNIIGSGDKIIMNILILAYDKPLDISEISERIGIPCAYLEPIIKELVDAQLMNKIQNKVYTDFIIYSVEDMYKSYELENIYAQEIYAEVIDIINRHFQNIDKYIVNSLSEYQKNVLLSYFAIKTLTTSMYRIRDDLAGHIRFEDYPDRPNQGKWYATGYHYPAGFDYENEIGKSYIISGESYNQYDSKNRDGHIGVLEFETKLGYTRRYWRKLISKEHDDCVKEFLKIMYLCGMGDEKSLFDKYGMVIESKALKNIDSLEASGFLSKDKKVNVPILTEKQFKNVRKCITSCENELKGKYGHIYREIYMNNYISVPKHIQSIPEYLKYMQQVNLPMMIILKAKENGKIFEGAEYNLPAVVIVEK